MRQKKDNDQEYSVFLGWGRGRKRGTKIDRELYYVVEGLWITKIVIHVSKSKLRCEYSEKSKFTNILYVFK